MSQARKPEPPEPDRFLIGRLTFFDFGPPLEFYEIFSARSTSQGTLIERLQVTPPGIPCLRPATIQVASASVTETIEDLLAKTNPCSIPEKDLRRERKRCRKCLVFSGADVVMEVQCGNQTRRIRMDILDRDMFDQHAITPARTSWTMALLGRFDQVLGSTIRERPAFGLPETPLPAPESPSSPLLEDLARGRFDTLFERGSDKPSELFRQAQIPLPVPSVELVDSSPFRPTVFALPKYPPIPRLGGVEGFVRFTVHVDSQGCPSSPEFLSGNPLLQKPIPATLTGWAFPAEAVGWEIQVVVEFKRNCPAVQK